MGLSFFGFFCCFFFLSSGVRDVGHHYISGIWKFVLLLGLNMYFLRLMWAILPRSQVQGHSRVKHDLIVVVSIRWRSHIESYRILFNQPAREVILYHVVERSCASLDHDDLSTHMLHHSVLHKTLVTKGACATVEPFDQAGLTQLSHIKINSAFSYSYFLNSHSLYRW